MNLPRTSSPFLLVCALATACSAPSLSVSPRLAEFELDGDLAARDLGGATNASTSTDELGLEDETLFYPRADLEFLGGRASLEYFDAGYEGDGTLQDDFELEGVTLSGDVATDLELALLSGAVTWDVIPTDFVDIALGVAGGMMDIEGTFTEQGGGQSADFDESVPLLMPAVRAGGEIGPVGVAGQASLIDTGWFLSDDELDADLLDLQVGANLRIFDGELLRGFVTAGWRQFAVDGTFEDESSEVLVDVDVSGPFVGVVLEL